LSLQDPIADMLTRIRNGHMARLAKVSFPKSKLKISILEVLKKQGYIDSFSVETIGSKQTVEVVLKYYKGKPVIEKITRVSKPSLRVYKSVENLPNYFNGLGINVVSTSKGLMTSAEAKEQNIGGELICSVV